MVKASISSLLGKITIVFFICLFCLPAQAKYGGGTGEPNDPYQIRDANHMQAIGADFNDWDKHFKLMADIDLSGFTGASFNIIGRYVSRWDPDNQPFTGSFDGNDHIISNLQLSRADVNGVGLFGFVNDPNAKIKNVSLINPHVCAGNRTGALVGILFTGSIIGCSTRSGDVSGESSVGGLVGEAGLWVWGPFVDTQPTISNCYSTVNVNARHDVGGLVGWSIATISCCYSAGSVSGDYDVGGLVGLNEYSTIADCFSTCSVSGKDRVGGLVATNAQGTITNCYAEGGSTSGDRFIGGLVGSNQGVVINCYVSGNVDGTENVGGLVGGDSEHVINSYWNVDSGSPDNGVGVPKTTAEMMMASTFVYWGVCGSVWMIDEGVDYPRLAWEEKPGETIVDVFPLEGNGDSNNPYLIHTPDELNLIGQLPCVWDKHFKLMADIDLIGYKGRDFTIIPLFTGVFDGHGHTITNFNYDSDDGGNIGLFGYVDKEAEIKNLGLIDPNIDTGTGHTVGPLVGLLKDGTITNCYVEGGSVFGGNNVGGLVGVNDGTISNCYSTCSVSGEDRVGGLVGENDRTITDCYAAGTVEGFAYVGGLVGDSWGGGTITNCYSVGSVSGDKYVGGLVGENDRTITDCYATGTVEGFEYVGGLVGYNNEYGTITNCYSAGVVTGYSKVGGLVGDSWERVIGSYWDTETSGQTTSAGGTGKTTAEMQNSATFFVWGLCGNGGVWTIEEGEYPRLAWEGVSGEPIGPYDPGSVYGGGSGEPNDPYLIYTAEELNTVGLVVCDWDKNFKMMADIDLDGYTGKEFNIIGECVSYNNPNNKPFTGIFDGNGHTITNFNYDSDDGCRIGLFDYVDDPNTEIKDLGLIDPNVDAGTGPGVGSLVGYLREGTITNCYVVGVSVSGEGSVGGLVGLSNGTITNCYSSGSVSGYQYIGGLIGYHLEGTITNCYSTGSVAGTGSVGGLVGTNAHGTITNCKATGSVSGNNNLGGLVGYNYGTITNCYSIGSVEGVENVGGLVGLNHGWCSGGTPPVCYYGTIIKCYSSGSVVGDWDVGGLVGRNSYGEVTASFWDIETSGQTTSGGGTGKTTAEMQMMATFTHAGWDFNTPVWTIDEGVDYPRLWWEMVPVLHAEPEITLGTSNIISWEPIVGGVEYYAECAEDAVFTSIIYNSGWIAEITYEFTGLQLGQRYWYSVKARNSAGIESQWSNVESSLQCTLSDAVDLMLDPNNLKSENLKKPYINKINIAQEMIDAGVYTGALSKLENDILLKTDGCAESGQPDKSDWIITCEAQSEIYPLIIETIEYVRGLTE